MELTQHVYQHKVEIDGKPITNQKSSGRCWIFACLNVIRIPFMKHFNLEEFEFSQSYLFFWDKIERCNYMLNNIVKTAKLGEPVDGRLVSFILHVSQLKINETLNLSKKSQLIVQIFCRILQMMAVNGT